MAGWGSQRAHTLRPPGPGASKRSRSIPAFWEPSLLLLAENEGGSCYPDNAGPALRRGSQPVRVCPKIVGQLRAVVLPGGQARQNRDTPPVSPSYLRLHPKLYRTYAVGRKGAPHMASDRPKRPIYGGGNDSVGPQLRNSYYTRAYAVACAFRSWPRALTRGQRTGHGGRPPTPAPEAGASGEFLG
jgi:hypothetical protein